jgi:hypothetical protein
MRLTPGKADDRKLTITFGCNFLTGLWRAANIRRERHLERGAVHARGNSHAVRVAREGEEARGMNRRKMLSLLGMSPALLAGARADAAKDKKPVAPADGKITTLNPKGIPPPITLVPMAPRLSTLDGKTIYLVSDGFPGADHFLDQISNWFKKNMPSVTTVYRLKAGAFADDDPKLNAEIKANGNAVIMAIGH